MLESLSFTAGGHSEVTSGEVTKEMVGCLLCVQQFDVAETQDELLRHLLLQHKLVIADVKLVAHFKKYVGRVQSNLFTWHLDCWCSVGTCSFLSC